MSTDPGSRVRSTASGTRFNMNALIAAHPSYPFGTVLRVTNVATAGLSKSGSSTVDRPRARGRKASSSMCHRAAQTLNFVRAGRTRVRVEVLRWGN